VKKSVKLRFVPAAAGQRVRAGDLLDRPGQLDVNRPDQIRRQPDRIGVNPPYRCSAGRPWLGHRAAGRASLIGSLRAGATGYWADRDLVRRRGAREGHW
jgi:hypothetical protein